MGEGVFLGQLQAFLETARLHNVTRAADALYLTQPALSARLKRLEQEVGGALLVRDHRGARLTEAGRAFLPYAERAVEVLLEAHRAVLDLSEETSGDLVVAATQTLATYVLPPVISGFVRANPAVRLSVRTRPSEEVLEMVVSGEAQLGMGRSLQHPDLVTSPLFEEEFVFAVGLGHRLAAAATVTVDDLADEIVITLLRSPTYVSYLRGLLRRSGVTLGRTIDLDNPETGKRMLQESFGVGLLPNTAVTAEMASGVLRRLDIAGIPTLRRTMVSLRLRVGDEDSSVNEFLGYVAARLAELQIESRNLEGAL